MTPLFAFLSVPTMIVLGIIAVLIFGRRLPDMAKYLGKSIVEFKKGMHGLESGFDDIANPNTQAASAAPAPAAPAEAIRPPQRVAPAAPKFDDVPAVPVSVPAPINPTPPQP
jgi:sec-independent protein translocase protein TatA